MNLDKKILRKDISNCLLCYDPPCSKACSNMKPGEVLFSIWMGNEKAAFLRVKNNFLCTNCSNKVCEKSCINKVDISSCLTNLVKKCSCNINNQEIDFSNLKTNFCGIEIENPFMLSSSCVGSNYEMIAEAFSLGWGGVVFKTISLMDIHEASPRFGAIKDDLNTINGFKNIEQLSDHSLLENVGTLTKLKKDFPNKVVVASIMGRDEQEWAYLAKVVSQTNVDAIELNFSCPNMTRSGTGSDVGQDAILVERFTKCVKKVTNIPIIAKLTPNVESMSIAAEAAKKGGADAIAAINTIKSLVNINVLNVEKTAVGGYSGRAVKPIALRFISEIANNKKLDNIPISAMGGIETFKDAIEFISLGASTLQITTAVMEYGYRIINELKSGLSLFLMENNLTLKELCGIGKKLVVDINSLKRDVIIYPKFNRNKCLHCLRCFISCSNGGHQAIKVGENRLPILIPNKCVGCHLCVIVCPNNAIVSSDVVIKKVQK